MVAARQAFTLRASTPHEIAAGLCRGCVLMAGQRRCMLLCIYPCFVLLQGTHVLLVSMKPERVMNSHNTNQGAGDPLVLQLALLVLHPLACKHTPWGSEGSGLLHDVAVSCRCCVSKAAETWC